MKVLITGINGFVGSHAAELLVEAGGVDIHGTVLRFDQVANIDHLRRSVTLHELDVTDALRVEAIVESVGPDRILHFAGQAFVPSSLSNPVETFQANIFGGLCLLEAARKRMLAHGKSPATLIVTSGEVYGRVEADQMPMRESLPLSPNTPYSASKASLDLLAQQYKTCFGVDVVIARPFNHAGPRQSPSFVISDFAKQFAEIALGKREPVIRVGNISVSRDFTDVRDVVKAYWKLFERNTNEFVFNVCSGQATEIRHLLEKLQEITQLNVEIKQEPARLRSYDVERVIASSERLFSATGWKPAILLRQTLSDTYAYWQGQLSSSSSTQAASFK